MASSFTLFIEQLYQDRHTSGTTPLNAKRAWAVRRRRHSVLSSVRARARARTPQNSAPQLQQYHSPNVRETLTIEYTRNVRHFRPQTAWRAEWHYTPTPPLRSTATALQQAEREGELLAELVGGGRHLALRELVGRQPVGDRPLAAAALDRRLPPLHSRRSAARPSDVAAIEHC